MAQHVKDWARSLAVAVARVCYLARELLHARGAAKKEIGMNKVSKSLS